MTMTEFEALRSDLAAMRSDMDARFAVIETKLDGKASAATIYQAMLAMLGSMVAVIVGTVVVLKALAIIP
jgi:hypothetical protein